MADTIFQTTPYLLGTITHPKHAVNMEYVEGRIAQMMKSPVRVVSTANIAGTYNGTEMTLTYGANGAAVIDGVTLNVNDRVLLAGQTTGTQNGIYVVTVVGDASTAAVLTRADDFNESAKIYAGLSVAVNSGTINADTRFKLTTDDPIVLDTTALTFIPDAGSGMTTKYTEDFIGDGLKDVFTVTHNLGTPDVLVSIRDLMTNDRWLTDIDIVDNNTIKLTFDNVPENTQNFRVTVIG